MDACSNGSYESVCILLDANADVNLRDSYGHNALIIALTTRRVDIRILRRLRAAGMHVEHPNVLIFHSQSSREKALTAWKTVLEEMPHIPPLPPSPHKNRRKNVKGTT